MNVLHVRLRLLQNRSVYSCCFFCSAIFLSLTCLSICYFAESTHWGSFVATTFSNIAIDSSKLSSFESAAPH